MLEYVWEIANRPVEIGALKILHPAEKAKNAVAARDQMKKEITAIQSVSHQSIVEIRDHDPNLDWYVSKFYPNGNLTSHLNRFARNSLLALNSIKRLVEGISELHKKEIVHRDIKPENIFVSNDNRLVLGDFGIAYFQEQDDRNTHTYENKGSRDWMPIKRKR